MDFDVVIVGAGPAGLSAAIRLKQRALERKQEVSVCVLEKAADIGGHSLSGAVFDPRALDELLPDWKVLGAPLTVKAKNEQFLLLTSSGALRLPIPPYLHNAGHYVISLGSLCRWLAKQAEIMGVEIFPGFAAADVLYDQNGAVMGVITGNMGLDKNGVPTSRYQPGVILRARQVLVAEGARGSLSRGIMERFHLCAVANPQIYSLGLKELWEISPARHREGGITHTLGWPLGAKAHGGGFLYHLDAFQVSVGLIVALNYRNPYVSPFEEFQRFKTHPRIAPLFQGGRRISYGARVIAEGGIQSLPKVTFPGGALIGDAAGFLDAARIKGIHTAMKSGMAAADTVFEILDVPRAISAGGAVSFGLEPEAYPRGLARSWLLDELYRVRNIRPGFNWGLWLGLVHAALDAFVFRGRAPWTLHHRADHLQMCPAKQATRITYPEPDGLVTFDKLSSAQLSATNHADGQPCHLKLKDPVVPVTVNLVVYDGPEERYCPAGVYNFVRDAEGVPRLRIDFQNCIHCKACDIKDPTQNIVWTTPQGGEGPNYPDM